jgi:hypothetical protein
MEPARATEYDGPNSNDPNSDGSNSDGPNSRTSINILRQYSSKATRDYVHQKAAVATTAGKGTGKGTGKRGAPQGTGPTGGKGPTPAEAHGPKRPGLQQAAGGEEDGGTAAPQFQEIQEDPPTLTGDHNARNRWGDGPPS